MRIPSSFSKLRFYRMIPLHSNFWACLLFPCFCYDRSPHHQVRISSNMNAMQLFLNITLDPATFLFSVSFPSMYRKLSYGNVYRSCCCIGILISLLCPNVVWRTDCMCVPRAWRCNRRRLNRFRCWECQSLFKCFAPRIPKILKIQLDRNSIRCVELLFLRAWWFVITKHCWHYRSCKYLVISRVFRAVQH